MSVPLAVIEDIIDASGIAETIEELLPAGARSRQLSVRTLLAGMHLTLDDGRPAHLTRVHAALASLLEADRPARASPRTGRQARTSSPTGRSSTPSA